MDSPSAPPTGSSAAVRQQAAAALGGLAKLLQASLRQHDLAIQRSAALSAAASGINPAQPPACHLFKTEPGQPPQLVLVRGAVPPDDPSSGVTYTPFADALAQRNQQLIKNAPRALDPPSETAG